jgi:hypothetical protein
MDDSNAIRRPEAPVGASDRLRRARGRAAMLGAPGVSTTDADPAGRHVTITVHFANIEPGGVRRW